jgi:hypothetical protein
MKKIVFLILLIISITYSKEIMNNNDDELIKQDVLKLAGSVKQL